MPIKLLIPGTREPAAPYSAAVRGATGAKDAPAPDDLLEPVHVLHAFSLSPMARDRAGEPQAVDVEDNDILELEIEGGFTLWTSVASYRDRLAELKPEALTNGAVRVDTLPGASIEQRGVRDWLSTALRVLRLEPDQISIEAVTLAGERIGAWAATKLLLHLIEKRLKPGPGLYSFADNSLARSFEPDQVRSVTDLPEGKPILVFIHGTASSTVGSFGALHAAEARPQWEELRRHFGEHIYAFEHRTLSESPIENAIQLAERLPRGARLHLVSHSRGGLVGDLLCLTDVSSDQLNRYGRSDPALAEADAQDKKDLKTLSDLLTDKRFEVVRFLRVASPARGTLLASENIDTFLSILTHLIGLIPGLAGNPIYHVLKRVTLEVAKNRCQPEMIPGIEAMIPSSPLVALLNTVVRPVASNLGIVAGDIEGGGLFKRLGVFLTDNLLYERRDNDLVVNTDSMFGGLRRLKSGHYVFDQGADVSHFNYFRNERTRVALVRWLTAPLNETPAEFRPMEAEGRPPVVMQRAARAGAQPVLILIPDVMGSKLSANGRAIWPEYLPLAEGRFTDLEITSSEVQPGSPIDDYLELQEYLGNAHDVVAFAYDWRKSIGVAAQELAKLVEARLQATALPVRFLAHGAGGLVVRAMIAQHPKLWDRICERPGGRLVMLGTPNHGSHAIAETLLGAGVTIKQLALL
ncbi:MAG TPA: hypothetical protein VLA73_02895, partial [Burkholderiales bacterium]|nr:hypothetical protein [Burkholderiales bacterium]